MALLPINTLTYDGFRTDALNRASQGLGYNVDGYYGYQCWDLAAELWQNIGFVGNYPLTGNGFAYGCWTLRRDENKGTQFTLIYNKEELQRGDIAVLDRGRFTGDLAGHIGFCDEAYNGTNTISMLGQNQVSPSETEGHIPTITNMNIAKFLGAFRYNAWNSTPPTPPTPSTGSARGRFPWVILNRKLRNRRNGRI